jgi:hypothetical protein
MTKEKEKEIMRSLGGETNSNWKAQSFLNITWGDFTKTTKIC